MFVKIKSFLANDRYMLSPVRLSVCNVRAPYSSDWIFSQFFKPFGTMASF